MRRIGFVRGWWVARTCSGTRGESDQFELHTGVKLRELGAPYMGGEESFGNGIAIKSN